MTLFEVLLVLVLLVVISSMAQPILDGAFSSVRLKRGSERVLAAWSELRNQAIQSGEPHQFLFQADSGTYSLRPWRGLEFEQSAEAQVDATLADEQVDYGQWQPYEGELPTDVIFLEGEELARDNVEQPTVQTLNSTSSSDWTEPILFFPDGSSTAATVLLKNDRDLVQRITLRSLTGIGRASDVMTLEESKLKKGR